MMILSLRSGCIYFEYDKGIVFVINIYFCESVGYSKVLYWLKRLLVFNFRGVVNV